MRKKILGILLVGIIVIGLTGCDNDNNANNESNNNGIGILLQNSEISSKEPCCSLR